MDCIPLDEECLHWGGRGGAGNACGVRRGAAQVGEQRLQAVAHGLEERQRVCGGLTYGMGRDCRDARGG